MTFYGRKLIRIIGGKVQPGDHSLKVYLRRVSEITGIGYSSLLRAWKPGDGYLSKQTKQSLQDAVRRTIDYDDAELMRRIEAHIHQLEAVDREMYGPDIDAARDFLARYADYSRTRMSVAVPCGVFDDSEE